MASTVSAEASNNVQVADQSTKREETSQTLALPEWEIPDRSSKPSKTSSRSVRDLKWSIQDKLNRHLPTDHKYLGLRRTQFLFVAGGICIATVALVLGLAIGLSLRSR